MQPKVSILIPVYNRESIISETIKSALSQTYQNIEVVIVDNASTDNTWQIIQNFAENDARLKAFRNSSNIGPVRNWLRCVEEASGEYGKILWSDDLISPTFVEKTLDFFNDDVGFVYTKTIVFSGLNPNEGDECYNVGATGLYPSEEYIKNTIFNKDSPVSPGCAIFRMKDIKDNLWLQVPNKINSDFSMHAIGNDALLFLLTANNYKYFGFVSDSLAFFRSHSGSISIASSSDGKLPLHYALAKAYFVEKYKPELSGCLASYIVLLLLKYRESRKYNISKLSDFFENKTVPCMRCLFKFLVVKLYGKISMLLKCC